MEDQIKKLQEAYKIVFESDHGKEVMKDLDKRCHYNATTNVRGDSHEVHIWKDNAAFFCL
jgi:hypothetical protein